MNKQFLSNWFRVIKSHPLRNILLILTTAIGTGALALSFQTTARLDRLVEQTTGGSSLRVVIANADIDSDGSLSWNFPFQFDESTKTTLETEIKGVEAVSVVNQMPVNQIQVGSQYWKPSSMLGTDQNYAQVIGLNLTEGSFFSLDDINNKEKVIVISERAAKLLFGSASEAMGKTIAVDNGMRIPSQGSTQGISGGRGVNAVRSFSPWNNFTVVGVYSDPTRFEAENYGIADYISPYSSMLPSGMNFNMPIRMFVARVSTKSLTNIESAIRTQLNNGQSSDEIQVSIWEGSQDRPGETTIENARQSLKDLSIVTSTLGSLILIIAAFGIVAGLLVDAADRSKEIALKRAIGMTTVRGALDLCGRSLTLAGTGGIIGLLFSIILSAPMRTILLPYLDAVGISASDLPNTFFEVRTLLAPTMALFLAFLFSLLPAFKAASSSIVEGLKEA